MERLCLPAALDSIATVVRYVRALARSAGLSERQANGLRLAAEEFVTNVVVHGYRRGAGVFELQGVVEPGRVLLSIVDAAPPFDPTRVAAPSDLHRPLAEREPGGLGIHLARSAVDRIAYEYTGGTNHLTLIVDRAKPPATGPAEPLSGAGPNARRERWSSE